MSFRLHHIDALRAFAMLLGIVLHAGLAYSGGPWVVRDDAVAAVGLLVAAIHGFRMELFFLLSGFFTAMLWRKRGLAGMLRQRALRILLPLVLSMCTIVPLVWVMIRWAGSVQGVPAPAEGGEHPPVVVALWFLFRFPLFHHLWFLWFLVWMVAGFAIVVGMGRALRGMASGQTRPDATTHRSGAPGSGTPGSGLVGSRLVGSRLVGSGWALAWLVPLTVPTFALMAVTREGPGFGADTSSGLLPLPGVLAHYAVFFGFGALLNEVPGALEGFARRWMVALVATLILLPVCLALVYGGDAIDGLRARPPLHALVSWTAQSLYAWCACIGLIGAFARLMPAERPSVRFVSDSSYWLYLVHLPLVIAGQVLLLPLAWGPSLKFAVLLAASTALLLVSYRWGVRYTVIGRLLNGPRARP